MRNELTYLLILIPKECSIIFNKCSNTDAVGYILLVLFVWLRIIHEGGFTKDDNKTYIPLVRSNTIQALVAIIRAMATLQIDYADSDREVFLCCLCIFIMQFVI